MRSLEKTPAIWLSVLRMLSMDINAVYDDMRSLAIRGARRRRDASPRSVIPNAEVDRQHGPASEGTSMWDLGSEKEDRLGPPPVDTLFLLRQAADVRHER